MAKYKIISYEKNTEYLIEADYYHIQDKLIHFCTDIHELIATFSVIDFYVIREDMSNEEYQTKEYERYKKCLDILKEQIKVEKIIAYKQGEDPKIIETKELTWVSYADKFVLTIADLERIEKGESYDKVRAERITKNTLDEIDNKLKKYCETIAEEIIKKYKK